MGPWVLSLSNTHTHSPTHTHNVSHRFLSLPHELVLFPSPESREAAALGDGQVFRLRRALPLGVVALSVEIGLQ